MESNTNNSIIQTTAPLYTDTISTNPTWIYQDDKTYTTGGSVTMPIGDLFDDFDGEVTASDDVSPALAEMINGL